MVVGPFERMMGIGTQDLMRFYLSFSFGFVFLLTLLSEKKQKDFFFFGPKGPLILTEEKLRLHRVVFFLDRFSGLL